MKKKLFLSVLVLTMSLSMTACAKTPAATESSEVEDEVVTSTVMVEPKVEETVEQKTEETKELTAEEIEAARKEDALNKLNRLCEAYEALMNSGDEVARCLQYDTNHWAYSLPLMEGFENFLVASGETYDEEVWAAVACHYYDNYVNNNGSYYDIRTWLASKKDVNEISKGYTYDSETGDIYYQVLLDDEGKVIKCCNANETYYDIPNENLSYDSRNIKMFEAARAAGYLIEFDIKLGDLVDCSNELISGIVPSYAYEIIANGEDTGYHVSFDENGNMLNVITDDDFVSTEPQEFVDMAKTGNYVFK